MLVRGPVPARTLALLLVGALALASCGEDEEPDTAGRGPGGTPLADEYVSVEVTAGGEPRPLVPGTEIRIRFRDDRLAASLGCNELAGGFRVDGTMLVVDELVETEVACDPERHEQDRWFGGLLTGTVQLLTSGDEMVINDGYTAVVLRDATVAPPDLPLLGTRWQVDGFLDDAGPEPITAPTAEPPAFLQLGTDGVVAGLDGCPSAADGATPTNGQLRFEVDGAELRFSGGPTGAAACEGPGADLAERHRSVLVGAATWSVDGDRLTITASDGRAVTYRAVDG